MLNSHSTPKVALVHDHLMQAGGAERVLAALHKLFPKAPIYTLFYDERVVEEYFPDAEIRATFLQRFPRVTRRRFRYLSPFAIPAIENLDLSQFDMVISSSSFFSKGVITRVGAVHISYCHTPTRKLWAERPVAGEAGSLFSTPSAHMLRLWDANAAARVDYFIANSRHTKRAIGKYYRRDAFVVYPPVDARALAYTRSLDEREQRLVDGLPENFYLVVSALYPHKRVRLAVEAFSKLSYPLVIIGAGPQQDHLERLAGEGTVLLGRQSDAVVAACYERCRALVHPAEDDFGIAPVEAMQYGKPVVAYRKGGVTETVVDHVSGEFFDVAHPAVLADAVRRLEEGYDTLNPALITAIGNRFGKDRFQEELRRVLKRILAHEMHAV